ncbi:MAG: hypothetical protein ABI447_13945, partial [Pseudomonas sp.]
LNIQHQRKDEKITLRWLRRKVKRQRIAGCASARMVKKRSPGKLLKPDTKPVGASLLAMTAFQSTSMLNVSQLSRAGSLPQWFWVI